MFKNFLMKQMFKRQLKDVPEAQQEKLLSAFEKNPKLFESMAKEIQVEMKKGKGQMQAALEVAKRHQAELKELM